MWEIFNYGDQPYLGLSHDKETIARHLKLGNRLQRPTTAPDMKIYDIIMKPCWQAEPNQRPSFTEMKVIVNALMDQIYINNE